MGLAAQNGSCVKYVEQNRNQKSKIAESIECEYCKTLSFEVILFSFKCMLPPKKPFLGIVFVHLFIRLFIHAERRFTKFKLSSALIFTTWLFSMFHKNFNTIKRFSVLFI